MIVPEQEKGPEQQGDVKRYAVRKGPYLKGELRIPGVETPVTSCYATFVSSELIDGDYQILLARKARRLNHVRRTEVSNNPGQLVIPGGGVDVPEDTTRPIVTHTYSSVDEAIKTESLRELEEETQVTVDPKTLRITWPNQTGQTLRAEDIVAWADVNTPGCGGCAVFVDQVTFNQITEAMQAGIDSLRRASPSPAGLHAELVKVEKFPIAEADKLFQHGDAEAQRENGPLFYPNDDHRQGALAPPTYSINKRQLYTNWFGAITAHISSLREMIPNIHGLAVATAAANHAIALEQQQALSAALQRQPVAVAVPQPQLETNASPSIINNSITEQIPKDLQALAKSLLYASSLLEVEVEGRKELISDKELMDKIDREACRIYREEKAKYEKGMTDDDIAYLINRAKANVNQQVPKDLKAQGAKAHDYSDRRDPPTGSAPAVPSGKQASSVAAESSNNNYQQEEPKKKPQEHSESSASRSITSISTVTTQPERQLSKSASDTPSTEQKLPPADESPAIAPKSLTELIGPHHFYTGRVRRFLEQIPIEVRPQVDLEMGKRYEEIMAGKMPLSEVENTINSMAAALLQQQPRKESLILTEQLQQLNFSESQLNPIKEYLNEKVDEKIREKVDLEAGKILSIIKGIDPEYYNKPDELSLKNFINAAIQKITDKENQGSNKLSSNKSNYNWQENSEESSQPAFRLK